MDIDEFLTWAAFVSMEPFHENRADIHTALLLQQQANMNRSKGQPAQRLDKFIPRWNRETRNDQTNEQRKEILKVTYLRMGGDPKAVS